MTELRSAIIGVGLAGENHLRALTALGLPVAGVLASRPERTEEAARRWRVRGYADLDDLLADPEATLIHVCTPPSSHRPLVEAAFDAGRAVLCEKPLAMSHAEARVLADRAARHPQPGWVGFNRRFDEGAQMLRRGRRGRRARRAGQRLGLVRAAMERRAVIVRLAFRPRGRRADAGRRATSARTGSTSPRTSWAHGSSA